MISNNGLQCQSVWCKSTEHGNLFATYITTEAILSSHAFQQ